MPRPYQLPGLILAYGSSDASHVRALQHDLRRLGYLEGAIDGWFGPRTEAALRALQRDLLHHDHGRSAPIRITECNRVGGHQAISAVTGVLDTRLAACIDSLLNHPRVEWLTRSNDPETANKAAARAAMAQRRWPAPRPFMLAILHLESRLRHFTVPSPTDADSFVVISLERQDPADPDHITGRRYGMAQIRLPHHPPQPHEIAELIADPVRHVGQAYVALRQRFDGLMPEPRLCLWPPDDPRHLSDCHRCALAADQDGGPDPADFLCDWPEAVRAYRGLPSSAYRSRVLRSLADAARLSPSGPGESLSWGVAAALPEPPQTQAPRPGRQREGAGPGLMPAAVPRAARNRSKPPRSRPS